MMGTSRCAWLAVGVIVTGLAGPGLHVEHARAETPATEAADPAAPANVGAHPHAVNAAVAAQFKPTIAPECTGRGDLLGVSRIVEIDTEGGPRFGEQYKSVEPHFLADGEVVLTFDDGPMRRYTLPILDALDEQCTKATFFSVGRMAVSDPATLQEVARRGHTIGTHTWSHKNLATLSADAMKREVELGLSAVAMAAGQPISPFFRFPYLGHGKASLAYIEGRGMGIFGIHVDSNDFRTRNPGVVQNNVLSRLARDKKGILLFHDIQPSTAGALRSLLAELKKRDFKVVHIVPRTAATTLPQYDAIAAKSLRGKSVTAQKNPLSERSVTWPVADGESDVVPVTGPSKPPAQQSAPSEKKPFNWANPTNDPWQLKSYGN